MEHEDEGEGEGVMMMRMGHCPRQAGHVDVEEGGMDDALAADHAVGYLHVVLLLLLSYDQDVRVAHGRVHRMDCHVANLDLDVGFGFGFDCDGKESGEDQAHASHCAHRDHTRA